MQNASFRGRPEWVPGQTFDRETSVGGFFRPTGNAPVLFTPGPAMRAAARSTRGRAKAATAKARGHG